MRRAHMVPWLFAALAAATSVGPVAAQTITRGPYLTSAGPNRITISWRTSTATGSRVDYGDNISSYTQSTSDPALVTNHEVTLTGLLAAHSYAYRVGTPSALLTPADATYAFKTAPLPGAQVPVRVWVVGDSGDNNGSSQAVRDKFAAYSAGQPPDLWLMLGDNAYSSGSDSEYQSGCFSLYPQALRKWPLFTTRGNHDALSSGAWNDYLDFFCLPNAGQCGGVPSGSESYYSYDWGPVHFICLDSEGSDRSKGGPMLRWLRQDLAATDAGWVVCYWHHPPYTNGTHNSDDSGSHMADMRQNVVPILDSTGVDLVLSGHSHGYERSYLLNGHYGVSSTLTSAMKVGPGDGRTGGNGAYTKPHPSQFPFEGAVYTVAGSSAKNDGVSSMPCMVASIASLGSMVLDFNGNRLDARFLDDNGAIRDNFTIIKGTGALDTTTPPIASLRLAVPHPNPARGAVSFEYELPTPGEATLEVMDAAGRLVTRLARGQQPAGPQRLEWRGAGKRGLPAPAGVYWAVLTALGQTRVTRVVLTP